MLKDSDEFAEVALTTGTGEKERRFERFSENL